MMNIKNLIKTVSVVCTTVCAVKAVQTVSKLINKANDTVDKTPKKRCKKSNNVTTVSVNNSSNSSYEEKQAICDAYNAILNNINNEQNNSIDTEWEDMYDDTRSSELYNIYGSYEEPEEVQAKIAAQAIVEEMKAIAFKPLQPMYVTVDYLDYKRNSVTDTINKSKILKDAIEQHCLYDIIHKGSFFTAEKEKTSASFYSTLMHAGVYITVTSMDTINNLIMNNIVNSNKDIYEYLYFFACYSRADKDIAFVHTYVETDGQDVWQYQTITKSYGTHNQLYKEDILYNADIEFNETLYDVINTNETIYLPSYDAVMETARKQEEREKAEKEFYTEKYYEDKSDFDFWCCE